MPSPMGAVVDVVARALVEHPDQVQVAESEHRGTTVIELSVGAGEMGRVIGRQGRVIDALRTLVAATAHHHGARAQLEIREPEGAGRGR